MSSTRLRRAFVARRQPVPGWTGPLFLLLGLATVVWVVLLAIDYAATPRRCPNPAVRCGAFLTMSLRQYNLAWVVFDIVLALLLLVTGMLALRGRNDVQMPAAITGTLLVVDAWFDIMTTSKSDHRIAVLEAVLVELPLAVLCCWLAVRAGRARRRR